MADGMTEVRFVVPPFPPSAPAASPAAPAAAPALPVSPGEGPVPPGEGPVPAVTSPEAVPEPGAATGDPSLLDLPRTGVELLDLLLLAAVLLVVGVVLLRTVRTAAAWGDESRPPLGAGSAPSLRQQATAVAEAWAVQLA